MDPFNQSSVLDQYPDARSATGVDDSLDYNGTALATQLLLHPICLYLTAALLSPPAAPTPQNCSLLTLDSAKLCVSKFGDNIKYSSFLFLSLLLTPRTLQGPLPRQPPTAAGRPYDHPISGHLEALQQGVVTPAAPAQFQVSIVKGSVRCL